MTARDFKATGPVYVLDDDIEDSETELPTRTFKTAHIAKVSIPLPHSCLLLSYKVMSVNQN